MHEGRSAAFALVRFHAASGARLAARAAAPLAGLPLAVVLLQQDPGAALRGLAAWIAGPRGSSTAGLALALALGVLAGWARPRVVTGARGWTLHLPLSSRQHRRAAIVAVAVAQSPLALGVLVLGVIAGALPHGVSGPRLASVPMLMAATSIAAWPGTGSRGARLLSLPAVLLLLDPSWTALGVSAALLLVAERVAGPIRLGRDLRRVGSPGSRVPPTARVFARAVGARGVGSAWLVAALPLAAMAALRVNNDLAPAVAGGAARLGGGLAIAACVASLAERLAARRPAWSWARSLPWSAARRVSEDAAWLAVPALLPVAATFALDAAAGAAVLALLPFASCRAAGAMRGPGRAGVATAVFSEGALLAAWAAILPALALGALAVAPLALKAAAERERRHKAGRWDELHHQAVGDTASWSAP